MVFSAKVPVERPLNNVVLNWSYGRGALNILLMEFIDFTPWPPQQGEPFSNLKYTQTQREPHINLKYNEIHLTIKLKWKIEHIFPIIELCCFLLLSLSFWRDLFLFTFLHFITYYKYFQRHITHYWLDGWMDGCMRNVDEWVNDIKRFYWHLCI